MTKNKIDPVMYIYNKYRDEFDCINDVMDTQDYINRLYAEGGMWAVDNVFFLPGATDEQRKDYKKLLIIKEA